MMRRQRLDRFDSGRGSKSTMESRSLLRSQSPGRLVELHQRPSKTNSFDSPRNKSSVSSPISSSSSNNNNNNNSINLASSFTLELEMEPEHDMDEDKEAFLLVQKRDPHFSPVRERTRAAHHNGCATPPPSPSSSISSLFLFNNNNSNNNNNNNKSQSTTSTPSTSIVPSKFIRWTLLILLGILILFFILPQEDDFPLSNTNSEGRVEQMIEQQHSHVPYRPPPTITYSCPPFSSNVVPKPANRDDHMHASWYDDVSNKLLQGNNLTNYLSVYRKMEFDNWGMTYEQVKEAVRDWKVSMYGPVFTQNPNRTFLIYESACGIGLNLALTTEILYETVPGIRRIEVYGNEYVQASVALAERLYEEGHIVDKYKGRMGRFCAADSTQLDHVPSNSFDIVFTGYITPLPDPLSIAHKYDSFRDIERAYQAICENKTNPELVAQMQAAQEAFYRKWVSEMIRIARPGAPVIVEQVSAPLCEAYFDWGGVARSFWNAAVLEWPVEASSLVFRDDAHMKKRYHVYFRKQTNSLR